ncbi:hypothetical protein [Bifidobacterium aemilianum]|nr:hypothetical protein [Bifidobacterium aemilianum]
MNSHVRALAAEVVSIAALVSFSACGRTDDSVGKDDSAVTSIEVPRVRVN